MKLDLRKIIDNPGAVLPFDCEISTDNLDFQSIKEYKARPHANGRVYNEAGVLHLDGEVVAEMVCFCDRCGKEFESTKETEVRVILVEDDPGDDPALFVVEGDEIDLDEVLSTCFILDMETKFLCSEDCNGAINYERGDEIDPRFAVLQQLLDK